MKFKKNTAKNNTVERTVVVSLRELTRLGDGRALRAKLLKEVQHATSVVVDFDGFDVRDSSVLACLVEALELAHRHGVGFFLTSVSGEIRRMLDLFRLTALFPVINPPVRG